MSYNSTGLIDESIKSFLPFLSNVDFEILIWENGKVKSEKSDIKNDKIQYFGSGQNIGFGAGINHIFNESSGDYLLIINPDTIAEKIQFGELIDLLDKEHIGVVGCHHIDKEGKHSLTVLQEPNLTRVIMKLLFINVLSDRLRIRSEQNTVDYLTNIEAINGSFLFLKRSVFESAGKFDERFFLYCEEIDFCRRIREMGKQIAFSRTNTIRHTMGESTPNYFFQLHNIFVSESLYIKKHHSKPYWLAFRIFNLADKLVRWIVNALLGMITLNGYLIKKSNDYLRVFIKNSYSDRYFYPHQTSM